MGKIRNGAAYSNGLSETISLHGEAVPPDVLAAKLEALSRKVEKLADSLQALPEQLAQQIQQQASLRPLLGISDLQRIYKRSKRSLETDIALGRIPPPLTVGGVRRWHPDAIQAHIKRLEREGAAQ